MATEPSSKVRPTATATSQPVTASLRTISSEALFCGGVELLIMHGTDAYRLRVTRQNRLILTK
ncbi:MAG TPA: hemin uptake protein HemP [Pseudomonadales bacterium]|nr:hemin uptake protein HemP [Pseudomonadales bacterium]HMY97972.1 hemin uptake protein HemP [Pseudomonadales bacterium]HMZ72000.1 hemin uptake protein HemP [Pseudomonadales bacterium]